jgi:hypothetical protein
MTNSIDRDQWLNVTSESRVKLMRARIFESFPLAPFRISGTHAPCYYPHGVASSTLRYYPSTEPITAPRKPIDQRPRPIPDQSSDVDRPLYSAFFLTVAIGNCMVKLIPPVNFCSDENIQTIFGTKLEDFLNYRIVYNSIS